MVCRRCSREFMAGDQPDFVVFLGRQLPVHAYDCSDQAATAIYVERFLATRGVVLAERKGA